MPLGGLFVGMGQRENCRLREWGAADLQTDRQTRAGEPARNRDRRQPVDVEGRGIAKVHRVQRRTLSNRHGRAWHCGRDEKIYRGEYLLDFPAKRFDLITSPHIVFCFDIRRETDDPVACLGLVFFGGLAIHCE